MLVVDIDRDLLTDSARYIELHAGGVSDELGSDMDLDTLVPDRLVRGEVLAFEMHVDRHVKLGATSTDWRNEVDRCATTALLDQLGGFGGEVQLHSSFFGSGAVRYKTLAGRGVPAGYRSGIRR